MKAILDKLLNDAKKGIDPEGEEEVLEGLAEAKNGVVNSLISGVYETTSRFEWRKPWLRRI